MQDTSETPTSPAPGSPTVLAAEPVPHATAEEPLAAAEEPTPRASGEGSAVDSVFAPIAGPRAEGRHAALPDPSKLPTNLTLVVLFMAVAGAIVLSVSSGSFDNDMWWLLATGREVVENGIPYTNPWSIHEGLDTVIQQWLAAVVLYGTYSVSGYMGLKVLVAAQCCVLAGVLYALCRVASGRKGGSGEVFAFCIAVAFVSLSAYLSVRPHLYSMTLFALVILVMELYRQRNRPKILALVPLLAMVHVNVHAAMAPFDLFIVALYLVPDIPTLFRKHGITWQFGFKKADYRRLPVLIALVASAVALLINPYGIRGALYLALSYGAAGYGNYINEMGSTGFWTDYGGGTMAMIVLGSIAVGANGRRNIDLPLTILFAVCIPLAMMHTRNVWLVALFALPLCASAFSTLHVNAHDVPALSSRLLNGVLGGVFVVAMFAYGAAFQWPSIVENAEKDTSSLPSKAMDYLDRYVAASQVDKSSLRIYNSFNCGGYLEWRGYKVFMDPRPELWEPGITGDERHYYQEFVDFAQDKTPAKDVVGEYDFDFIIAYTSSELNSYLKTSSAYQLATSGSGYQVWAKVDLDLPAED